jgi:hypothetical protein
MCLERNEIKMKILLHRSRVFVSKFLLFYFCSPLRYVRRIFFHTVIEEIQK